MDGVAADDMIVRYQNREMRLSEAFRRFAENLLRVLTGRDIEATRFNPFVLEFPAEAQ